MPPWGATQPRVGNNPLVLAVPRAGGHVVLDIAMSQFSFGKLGLHKASGQPLPAPGGYDQAGELSRDAAAVLQANRLLPIGLWKGSGLALMLDMIAAVLSGGLATCQLAHGQDHCVSQVFLAFDPARMGLTERLAEIADLAVESVTTAAPVAPGEAARYPGQRCLQTRRENMDLGIPVDPACWQRVLAM